MSDHEDEPITRVERKERTRRAILDAALELSAQSSLAGLSLRHVAREVGISPTAFYRHFDSVEDLGLALVDESFQTLRRMLHDMRRANPTMDKVIARSVAVLVEYVRAEPRRVEFVSRERVGVLEPVRVAVRHQLDLFEADIATDFARMPGAVRWTTEDLRISANLIVTAVVAAADRLLHVPAGSAQEAEIVAATITQLRMLTIGARNWESRG